MDFEEGSQKFFLYVAASRWIEQGYLEDVILIQHISGHTQVFRHQTTRRDATTLAVTAVAHLDRRFVYVLTADRNRAGKPRDSAATFGLVRFREPILVALGPQ